MSEMPHTACRLNMKKCKTMNIPMPRSTTQLLQLIAQRFPKASHKEILSDAVFIGLASIMSSSKYSARRARPAGRNARTIFTREP